MNAYYDILDQLKTIAEGEDSINQVTHGSLDDFALDKFNDWGLVHLVMTGASHENGTVLFDFSIFIMDRVHIIDEESSRITETAFRNMDNEMDVLNETLSVGLRIAETFRRGDIIESGYHLVSSPTFEPFTDRFTKPVAGWVMSLTLQVAHDIQHC